VRWLGVWCLCWVCGEVAGCVVFVLGVWWGGWVCGVCAGCVVRWLGVWQFGWAHVLSMCWVCGEVACCMCWVCRTCGSSFCGSVSLIFWCTANLSIRILKGLNSNGFCKQGSLIWQTLVSLSKMVLGPSYSGLYRQVVLKQTSVHCVLCRLCVCLQFGYTKVPD
jgi:hypothetical protein